MKIETKYVERFVSSMAQRKANREDPETIQNYERGFAECASIILDYLYKEMSIQESIDAQQAKKREEYAKHVIDKGWSDSPKGLYPSVLITSYVEKCLPEIFLEFRDWFDECVRGKGTSNEGH